MMRLGGGQLCFGRAAHPDVRRSRPTWRAAPRGLYRRLRIGILALLSSAALTACAASSYAGIPLRPGGADAALQDLARRAQSGDKQAQLDLGIRYEEGRGVPVDLKRARRLYAAAATTSGGTQLSHFPATPKTPAAAVPIDTGPRQDGLSAARARLAALDARRGRVLDTKLRTVRGVIVTVGPSDVCETDPDVVRASTRLAIGQCRAKLYRLTDRKGRTYDLTDLILYTNDEDAAIDEHIPLGLIDPAETWLSSDEGSSVRGAVTFEVLIGAAGAFSIIRSAEVDH
ncbi:sel1 repeat family protein [Sphingomonas parva]|uniref:Sel1 repeat family protein n=1 Tax=Sphingomonas parva TaxID=2555898 RepID=A0A4Y8ZM44_9SPHN|nr:sel1 repeat family protein [Sphingomonas parva]TFI56527.1 sel1 repeat family protein [Sphingomonas parva]